MTAPRPEIALSSATYLGLALEAMKNGDLPRVAELIASIDEASWTLMTRRMPGLPELITRGVR